MDWEKKLVMWVVNDSNYTYFDTFVELESELIQCHHEIGHDVGLPAAWHALCLEDVEEELKCSEKERANGITLETTNKDIKTVRYW